MSEKCNRCKYSKQSPNTAIVECKKKKISMLEPVEFIYMNIDCDTFIEDQTKPDFLDANHRVKNIPVNKITTLPAFDYHPTPRSSWIGELGTKTEQIMDNFIEHILDAYGRQHTPELEKVFCDVRQQMRSLLGTNEKRTLTAENKDFFITVANNFLCNLQSRVWKVIFQI